MGHMVGEEHHDFPKQKTELLERFGKMSKTSQVYGPGDPISLKIIALAPERFCIISGLFSSPCTLPLPVLIGLY